MATDTTIGPLSGPAPQSYEVPNAQEIIPRSVRATFNGTAAAVAFFPTIRIISDGGVIVAEVATDTSVAAGGSASVTFAPFLKPQAASSSGGVTKITSADGSVTVTNPFGPITDLSVPAVVSSHELISFAATIVGPGATAHLAWTHAGGSSLLDLTVPASPTFKAAGAYGVTVDMNLSTNPSANAFLECVLVSTDASCRNSFINLGGVTTVSDAGTSLTTKVALGDPLDMRIISLDGALNNTVSGAGTVVRFS